MSTEVDTKEGTQILAAFLDKKIAVFLSSKRFSAIAPLHVSRDSMHCFSQSLKT